MDVAFAMHISEVVMFWSHYMREQYANFVSTIPTLKHK